jgi:gamma-glutamyltranspeptidase/glutathione hydrolase
MSPDADRIVEPGPRTPLTGLRTAWSVDHPAVAATVARVLADGGNAFDAGVAGALTECAVSPHLTSLAGAVTALVYDAARGEYLQLESSGTMPADLPPFMPAIGRAVASIPGTASGLKALHERFGSRPWSTLCSDAVEWAEIGHVVSSFEYGVLVEYQHVITHSPAGRALFRPGGRPVSVGERLRNPALAATFRALAAEGPDHLLRGSWAREFVRCANEVGWRVSPSDMTSAAADWLTPLTFEHRGRRIVAQAPPQLSGVVSALTLGILAELGVESMEFLSADHLFALTHTLRHALQQGIFVGDPRAAEYDWAPLLDRVFHRHAARLLSGLRSRVDLTRHTALRGAFGDPALGFTNAIGDPTAHAQSFGPRSGSCELSIVDGHGNWVQLMTTCAAGGIPGQVVGGVPMHGSAYAFSALQPVFHTRLVPGIRPRSVTAHTMIAGERGPAMALGTPGAPFIVMPQVLSNLLDFALTPQQAIDAPRCSTMDDQESFVAEDRIGAATVAGLAARGVRMRAMAGFEWHTGSIQTCWREGDALAATTDPRRTGVAGGEPV